MEIIYKGKGERLGGDKGRGDDMWLVHMITVSESVQLLTVLFQPDWASSVQHKLL